MLGLLLTVIGLVASRQSLYGQYSQIPVHPSMSYERYDAGLLSPPVSLLSDVPNTHWTALSHPLHPGYGVRVRKTAFCDNNVNGYTGYIDIQARHLFFYFFESRNDPDNDDVILWTNGGPGGSSSIGLFFELGPCRIPDANGPKFHPESWNTNANIIFIDQPIGVGFSYAEFGETVFTTEEAATDIVAFLAIFFDNFVQFKARPLHLAGESYGGRYIPLFGSAVYDQNARRVEAGLAPLNLTSVMIGNGMTDRIGTILSYYDMQCTPVSLQPFVDITSCVHLKQMLDRCHRWMTRACDDHFDHIDCNAAWTYCSDTFTAPILQTNRNSYDMSKTCDGIFEETLCYPDTAYIRDYLSQPVNQALLGVDPAVRGNFSFVSWPVNTGFTVAGDHLHLTTYYVAALLERGVRVLIYVGTYDLVCNHVGNERWTLALDWSGKQDYGMAEKHEWFVDKKRAGQTRSARGLTFATVEGAGHMAPYDKPKETLAMVQRWLARKPL